MSQYMAFHHGGQLDKVKQDYPEQLLSWVDLSTGISPFAYPVKDDLQDSFKCLPQAHNKLLLAMSSFYGVDNGLPIPGSMWAIQNLPVLRKLGLQGVNDFRPVLLPYVGFAEHAKAWATWGFNIEYYDTAPGIEQLLRAQACIVINPNNPSGHHYAKDDLLSLHKILSNHNAWLIIDEAFIDTSPESSCVAESFQKDLIVLRSFGKYFGLPGVRLGAMLACETIILDAKKLLNEWSINSAAQMLAVRAFLDKPWQNSVNIKIKAASLRLKQLLLSLGLESQGSDFFQTYRSVQAKALYEYLLSLGVYVRLLDDQLGIRIGLPCTQCQWSRLEHALTRYLVDALPVNQARC